MSVYELERDKFLSELCSSEKNYLIHLTNIIKHFKIPLAKWGLEEEKISIIFSNIEKIKDSTEVEPLNHVEFQFYFLIFRNF